MPWELPQLRQTWATCWQEIHTFFAMISGTHQIEECPKMYSQAEAPEITSVNQMIITWNGKHMQITFYDELRVNGVSKISWSYQNCLKSLICSTIPCVYVLKLTWTASAAAYPAAWPPINWRPFPNPHKRPAKNAQPLPFQSLIYAFNDDLGKSSTGW